MAEIVNLRQMKKRRARAEKRARGDEAAARSGQSKATRSLVAAEAAAAASRLDGHRRVPAEVSVSDRKPGSGDPAAAADAGAGDFLSAPE